MLGSWVEQWTDITDRCCSSETLVIDEIETRIVAIIKQQDHSCSLRSTPILLLVWLVTSHDATLNAGEQQHQKIKGTSWGHSLRHKYSHRGGGSYSSLCMSIHTHPIPSIRLSIYAFLHPSHLSMRPSICLTVYPFIYVCYCTCCTFSHQITHKPCFFPPMPVTLLPSNCSDTTTMSLVVCHPKPWHLCQKINYYVRRHAYQLHWEPSLSLPPLWMTCWKKSEMTITLVWGWRLVMSCLCAVRGWQLCWLYFVVVDYILRDLSEMKRLHIKAIPKGFHLR